MNLFTKVIYKSRICIVTNHCIARGKYIQISPIGNGNNPAKYYVVFPDEVTFPNESKQFTL